MTPLPNGPSSLASHQTEEREPHPHVGVITLVLKAARVAGRLTVVPHSDLGRYRGLSHKTEGVAFISDAQSERDAERALLHEFAHIAYPDAPEEECDLIAARCCVPIAAAQAVADGEADLQATAARLAVHPALLRARLADCA